MEGSSMIATGIARAPWLPSEGLWIFTTCSIIMVSPVSGLGLMRHPWQAR
jgi:hypothetical protein